MNNIAQTTRVVVLATVLSFGLSYAYAWTAPTQQPPNGNTNAPLNVGSAAQTKGGQLNIATGVISVDTQLGSFSAPGSTAGVGYTTFGSNPGGFVGWDYANNGIALNAHQAGGSIGGLFVQRVDNAHSNVGIGTTAPGNVLDVVGNSYLSGTVNAKDVYSRDAGKWMSQLQQRVSGSCAVGSAVTAIAADGSVSCGSAGAPLRKFLCYYNPNWGGGSQYTGQFNTNVCTGSSSFASSAGIDSWAATSQNSDRNGIVQGTCYCYQLY